VLCRFLGATLAGLGVYLAVWVACRSLVLHFFQPFRLWDVLLFLGTFGFGGAAWSLALVVQYPPSRAPAVRRRIAAWGVVDRFVGATCLGLGFYAACWLGVRSLFYHKTLHPSGWEWLLFPALFGFGGVLWSVGGKVLATAPQDAERALAAAKRQLQRRITQHAARKSQA
jgi:hypothetical protein